MCGLPPRQTWAEIDLDAFARNVGQLRRLLSARTRMMAIVKANGYGHGAVAVAREAVAAGVSYLGVGLLEEAVELREAGLKAPIVILGFVPKEYAPFFFEYEVTPSVFTQAEAEAFSMAAVRAGKPLDVHVEVDTGMGRYGCSSCESADSFILWLKSLPYIRIAGLYTHFATADLADQAYARLQLDRFNQLTRRLEAKGVHIPLKHAANSAAAVRLPESQLDMVRLGISLYGLYPSGEVKSDALQLLPVMSLKSRIVFLKSVPAGSSISYGRTFVASENCRVATLPVGYGDGYPRRLSNLGEVLVRGRRVPVIGRVCMDQTMLNVQAVRDVSEGDEAVLFGRQGEAVLTVDEVAGWLDTINYEVVTSISGRVPRVFVRGDSI